MWTPGTPRMLLLCWLLLVPLAAPQEQEQDPCQPNPCGENTLCYSNGGIIGCECVAGFIIPEGGDPFDGCFQPGASASPRDSTGGVRGQVLRDSQPQDEPVQEPRSLEEVREPPSLEGGGREGGSRLQEGRRPGHLAPRRPAATARPNVVYQEVDTKELFPDECLIHEDCEDSHFCNPQELSCHDACSLPVCGSGALCSSKLHRPVCSCPSGFEGNPYDTCVKSPSRVGMKFKRK